MQKAWTRLFECHLGVKMGCQFGAGKKLFRFGVKDQSLFNAVRRFELLAQA